MSAALEYFADSSLRRVDYGNGAASLYEYDAARRLTAIEACPECGWVPAPEETRRNRPDVHGAGELAEFDDSTFEYRRQIWNLIEAEREAMGYREGCPTRA